MSGQCYKGVNGQIANKNCQVLETRAYACKAPIDASNYIGVAFDITKGYGQAGFRGAIVKVSYLEFLFMFFVCVFFIFLIIFKQPWCREGQIYKNIFDVPDGMHIQGVYETQMEQKTYSSVSDYISAMSTKSNAQVGGSAFNEDATKVDSTQEDFESFLKKQKGTDIHIIISNSG